MILVRDLMVQLDLIADFKRKFLQCYGTAVPIKVTIVFLGQQDLTSHNMRKVVMQTVEQVSTREAT